jgi:putative transposase
MTEYAGYDFYRRNMPHYRSAGRTYHCRFSIHPSHYLLCEDWMLVIVESCILRPHKHDCIVCAYVLMPNHVHLVIQPLPRENSLTSWSGENTFHSLESIVGKIKGRSSYLIHRTKKSAGALWRDESFDRTIRGQRDLDGVIDYIHSNPVRWKLVERPDQYRWSSASTIYSGEKTYQGWFDLPPFGVPFATPDD